MLKDSGKRTVFETGAAREITDDKGRCDLVYNKAWGELVCDEFYIRIEHFVRTGDATYISKALHGFIDEAYNGDYNTAYLEVAKHYQEGAKKYADRNMEKGLPFHSLIDSALRHYTKWRRHDTDEPHDRAVIWNLLTLKYNIDFKPEMNDLPFAEKGE